MTVAAAITQLDHIAAFFFAGYAKFTLVSKKTGERKTFQVKHAPARAGDRNQSELWFVSLLIGPENTSDFRYVCCVFKGQDGQLRAKLNKERWGSEAFAAIVWLLAWFNARTADTSKFFEQVEFWHAGECARCGRELTDPESIQRGLGPVCAEKS